MSLHAATISRTPSHPHPAYHVMCNVAASKVVCKPRHGCHCRAREPKDVGGRAAAQKPEGTAMESSHRPPDVPHKPRDVRILRRRNARMLMHQLMVQRL